jgi:uncharacterized membrane protein
MPVAPTPVFEALIVPHRSLTPVGVTTLIGAIVFVSLVTGVRFGLLGAWPVAVFSFLEIPLVVVLLALNMRQARASELIMLTTEVLTVIQTDPGGRRKQISIPAAWLRIDLHEDRGVPRVILSSHGRHCEVGAFLHERNKVSLFEALRDALHRSKNPRFNNPQLDDQR